MNPVWIAFGGLLFTVTMAMLSGAFFMGRLSQRVMGLEKMFSREAGTHDEVIRLVEQMKGLEKGVGGVQKDVTSLQRQIATLMGRKDGRIIEMPEGV